MRLFPLHKNGKRDGVKIMKQPEKTSAAKQLKIIIIVLAVLLVVSAGGLAARQIYRQILAPSQATAAVPDNQIGESAPADESHTPEEAVRSVDSGTAVSESKDASDIGYSNASLKEHSNTSGTSKTAVGSRRQETTLELYKGKPSDNQRFEVTNMFPGDTRTQYFCVRAAHDTDLELFFRTDIVEQTKALGDLLHIKVTHLESGRVLCDAPFSAVNGKEVSEVLKANSEKSTIASYQIDVSLDTSVGNEYQASMLNADLNWYVKDADEGGLVPPQTSDPFQNALWIILIASFLLLIVFLWKQRKEVRHE